MNWQETLDKVNDLKAELKSRSYIFAVQDKEYAAIFFDQPIDTYYHLTFIEWSFVNKRYSNLIDCMSRDIGEVEKCSGKDLRSVSFIKWLPIYREWLKTQI